MRPDSYTLFPNEPEKKWFVSTTSRKAWVTKSPPCGKITSIKTGMQDAVNVLHTSTHFPKSKISTRSLHTYRWCVGISKPFLRSQLPVLIQWANRLQFFHLRLRDGLSHFLETLPNRRGVQLDLHRGLVATRKTTIKNAVSAKLGGTQ